MPEERPPMQPCRECHKAVEPVKLPRGWLSPTVCRACIFKAAEEEEIERARKQKEAAKQRLALPPRFQVCTFDNFQKDLQGTAYKIASDFAQKYTVSKKLQEVRGIYFYGMAGSGKTHLAAAIGNYLMEKEYVHFTTAPELLLKIKRTFDQQRPDDVLERLSETPLLIIDDIGSEKPTEWVQETLFILIDRRYTHFRPTIYTSNYSLDQLKDRLGYRIASRIAEVSEMVELRPNDYRIRKTK